MISRTTPLKRSAISFSKAKKGELLPSLKTLAQDENQPWEKALLPWYQYDEKNISYRFLFLPILAAQQPTLAS